MSARSTSFVGAISGTSIDGLDIALIDVAGAVPKILAGTTVAFDSDLRQELLQLATGDLDGVDALGSVETKLGRFTGIAILEFLEKLRVEPGEIHAIGSHGQTIRHRPDSALPFTIQVGDPNLVAELTGITTVADFRRRDIAAGGQGAPLVPLFHDALFRTQNDRRTVLNIGGISNVTTLLDDGGISGFDTGPGNALLDAWISKQRGLPFDRDGGWAASGRADDELLRQLLNHPYFAALPPKSTGRETFNLDWLNHRLSQHHGTPSPADVQATLAELTSRSIARAVGRWGHPSGRVIVCGGGRSNVDLKARLDRAMPGYDVVPSEALGVNGDWLEAAAFAWLAHRRISALPGNVPSVTGALSARILGAVYAGGSGSDREGVTATAG